MSLPAVSIIATWLDASTTDLSDRLLMSSGVAIQRGRQSEIDDPATAGTITLMFDNTDGTLTPGVNPLVTEGALVQVSIAGQPRSYGRAMSWTVGWSSGDGSRPVVTVTLTDAIGALPSTTLREPSALGMGSVKARHYWPLKDSGAAVYDLQGAATMWGGVTATGWGEGGSLPMNDDGNHILFKGTDGITLPTTALTCAAAWKVAFVLPSAPTGACTLLRLAVAGGGSTIELKWSGTAITGTWNGSTAFSASVTVSSWPVVVEFAKTATPSATLAVYRAAGLVGSVSPTWPGGFTFGALAGLSVNPAPSAGINFAMGHLTIDPSAHDYAYAVGSRVNADHWSKLKLPASIPTVVKPGGTPSDTLPKTSGRTFAAVLAAMATGYGARIQPDLGAVDVINWVPGMEVEAAIIDLPARFGRNLTWQTSSGTWRSDVRITWNDGSSSVVSRDDGWRRVELSIEGVHATPADDLAYAEWLLRSASLGGRLPEITYQVLAMSSTDRDLLLSVDIGDRVRLSGMPAPMPSQVLCIVEGIQEQLSSGGWALTFSLSPDQLSLGFRLDDDAAGRLDSDYVLFP